jgi:hypothetical protein
MSAIRSARPTRGVRAARCATLLQGFADDMAGWEKNKR